ncbi:hypothetical protein ACMD2_23444 [Ananas comosus]|uniref:Uncharacterized protein n=1 Tax=Ananas comosus TaxID=4615 RepID=A0A199VPI8_ANACO|nr:hypothetical protein ACMD2_23444 [Ananas comosus]
MDGYTTPNNRLERVVWQIEALEVDRSCRTAGNQLRRFITSGGCEGEAEVLKFLHCAEFQHRLLAIGIGKENLVKLQIGGCKGEVGVQNFSISTLLLGAEKKACWSCELRCVSPIFG